jgi:hypothetical protein
MGSAVSSSQPPPTALSSFEKDLTEQNWNDITNPNTPLPSHASPSSKLYRHHFYSLCYQLLKQRTEEYYQQHPSLQKSYEDPHALHTIVIFMLKLLVTYLISLKPFQKTFNRYAKSLALSSLHLGILSYNYTLFQDIFLQIIQQEFPEELKLQKAWKNVFTIILNIVIPECQKQEASTSIQRPLRMSGNSNLRAISEDETCEYYAEYAYKLILISTDNGDAEGDPYSVNSRLSTSMHNSVDFGESIPGYRSQTSL